MPTREEITTFFRELQESICTALSAVDGSSFRSDLWQREDADPSSVSHGGGGDTRVLKDGGIFEQAGVNFSEVFGTLPADMSEKLLGVRAQQPFFATGVSLVIHPRSPMIPTTHANFRYLEVADSAWFGGGADLTPYYLFEEDAIHFHQTWKAVCDQFDPAYYPDFKKQCDSYFYLPHRKETRGIGGIFFDYLGKTDATQLERHFAFVQAAARQFVPSYLPIVERRSGATWTEAQRSFQLMRRGRYVEFNLLYDRGTLFGLRTNGRTESILMSLPPQVRWEYAVTVAPDSPEAKLIETLHAPREWV